ncbi:cyclic nucleotide-gated ion channel 1-like [Corylus avellana]|uniref:cyclic nucleotide-gated ion channel 1-like n=1 Tax=Corylus avellana TaxID=13451 RepID=UPI00286C4F33|nr:cyclic nucleotide-gated ion channel 1-like [Corylus avellana]
MSYHGRHRQEKGLRNQDIEGQVSKTDGDDSGQKRTTKKTILDPEGQLLQWWNIMFAVSCVIAVSVDPLFFYLPVINGDAKCVWLDKRLKIVAITLRSVTDFIYVMNIIIQFICPYIDEDSRKLGRIIIVRDPQQIANRYFFSRYFVIDVLAVLPIPQVLFPIIFSKVRGSRFLDKRKFLNAVIFCQYVPRILRIYISWINLTKSASKLARLVWIKAAFNFFLYILASHVLGAFWYLFSVQRETACWHKACEKHVGCTPSSFSCNQPSSDRAFLDYYCPVQTPNTTLFDFGIFFEALQSHTLESTDFPRKLSHCFWWGLRNLSSFGQNLQTSTYFWENCFAVCISIFGLLLFLHFIGNLQTYIQLATERSEEIIKNMRVKEREMELWIFRNQLPSTIKEEIMSIVQHMLEEKKDVDVQNLLSHLPIELGRKIKRYICLPMLKQVPQLQGKGEQLLQLICEYLKPMHYNQHNYIVREGEPLDAMLFITQGIIWNFTTSINAERSAKCIEKGSFYGEELLDWGLECSAALPNLSDLPISLKTAKTHTKVEAFALMANDLRTIVSRRTEAASCVQALTVAAFRRINERNNEKSSLQLVAGKRKIELSSALLPKGNKS